MSIQVGDLVEVIFRAQDKRMCHFGQTGKVISYCNTFPGNFDIEGMERDADGTLQSFPPKHLRKINPGNEACDESFSDLINDCNEVMA